MHLWYLCRPKERIPEVSTYESEHVVVHVKTEHASRHLLEPASYEGVNKAVVEALEQDAKKEKITAGSFRATVQTNQGEIEYRGYGVSVNIKGAKAIVHVGTYYYKERGVSGGVH